MTQTVRLYGLKRCSTCVKALRWLEARNVPSEFIDYREQPVEPGTLLQWAQDLGGWDKLINRASTSWRTLPEASKSAASDAEWLALIRDFPTLIKRPVMVKGGKAAAVGFSEKKYQELAGQAC